jgi:hypothetical protein
MRNNGVDARASVNNISNQVDPRAFERSFNGLNRNQSANTESSTSRDPRLNSNSTSTPRLNNDSRTGTRLVNNVNNVDSRGHNRHILRSTMATMNHRDNLTSPYRRPIPKNIHDSNNNNSIGGVTNVVSALNGLAPAGSNNTSISAASSLAKNHQNASISQINSPAARSLSSNNNTNGQGNGDGLTRTLSNSGMITNNTGQLVGQILLNTSGQVLDPSKISVGPMNSASQLEAQKINTVKQQRNRVQPSAIFTPEQISQQLSDSNPAFLQHMQKIISLKASSNPSTSTVAQQINNQNGQRQTTVQTSRQQNITVPSVGSNVPSNSTVSQNIVLSSGMVQSPSPSVMRQNNIVQSSGSSGSVPQNFALANGFNISPSGSSNVRQNIVQSNGVLRQQIVSIGVNGSQNINMNTNISLGNNGSQTINVNPNVTIGTNGSQQAFVHQIHPNGIVNINNMVRFFF